ncbi:hypothetical protein M569_15279, partial [Genlisea aurea]
RKPTRFHSFHTFADPGVPPSFSGAFRDNILQFLQRCAEPEDYTFEGMPIWSTFLVYDSRGIVLPLYTVEENVKHSNTPFCDYCRCSGWSHHFVSKRKYHFIIPGNDSWNGPLVDGAFELQSHLLHGLIHGNGFGHLICINGIEGGSKYIPGRDIMDFWDRICTALHVRKITLEDLSKKDKMDLRLLYGVAYGNSWFSRWGYKFFHGSFGVKEYNFDRAMDVLSSLELDQAIEDFAATDKWMQIKQIVHHYREMSSASLVTLRDLFGYLLTSKPTIMPTAASFPRRCSLKLSKTAVSSRGKPPAKCRKFSSVVANLDSRWPARRLETTAQVIVEALKRKRDQSCCLGGGMTRQEVRDAARLHIGDTGLIDHVLKVMNNVVLGNCVVERSVNRSTKVLEYVIRESRDEEYAIPAAFTGRGDASSDLDYLYRNVLLHHPDPDKAMASQIILNSKRYMKEWPFRDEDDDLLRFICRLTSSCFRFDGDVFAQVPPSEHVAVPLYSTVGDLKVAVRKALQDTYCVMEKAEAVEILGTEEMQEDEVIFGICESGEEIWVRVLGLDTTGDGGGGGGGGGGGRLLVYEAGTEKWSVECRCGAKDDDGERMMSCDVCETWQHTRCSGIEDHEPVPRLFVCEACCSSLAPATEKRFEDGF